MSRPSRPHRIPAKKKSKKCGKWRYSSELRAIEALTNANRTRSMDLLTTGSSSRGECRIYECPVCHGWHLTKKEFFTPLPREPRSYAQTVPEPLPAMAQHVPSGHILRDIFAASQRASDHGLIA